MADNKAKYIDGFVLIVPKDKIEEYKKMAQEAGRMWEKHGALDYKECMGDDLSPDMGGMEVLTFPEMTKAKENETVWFSFITYKSKEHRDEVNKKVMAEMEKKSKEHKDEDMPFDMKHMAYGGFSVEVDS